MYLLHSETVLSILALIFLTDYVTSPDPNCGAALPPYSGAPTVLYGMFGIIPLCLCIMIYHSFFESIGAGHEVAGDHVTHALRSPSGAANAYAFKTSLAQASASMLAW
jgi:ABC-type phosphate transport system permease subunit